MRATLMSWYDARPASITLLLSAAALLLVWSAPLFGGAVIPYDYQAAHYPWYVDAIRAARYSPFCLYNPFNDAGVPAWNLFAFNDPVQWLPVLLPSLPGYTALQSLELAHLILIPIGLLLVAWANDVSKRRWILIVPLSLAAYAMGPTLKLMQQSVGIVAYAYVVLLFGALEAFRRSGSVHFAVLAGVCAAYVFEAFVYPAIFLPIALAAYAYGNRRQLFATRRRAIAILAASVAAVLIASPALLISVKIDRSLEIAYHLVQVALPLPEALTILGAPSAALALVAIPSAVLALAASAFAGLDGTRRWSYGVAAALLVLYGFGDVTPFGPFFRHVYPLADLVRRPYATWYVLLPFVLVLATIGLRTVDVRVVRMMTAVSLVATAVAAALGAGAIAVVAILLSLFGTVWRPSVVVLVAVATAQWLIIDWIPFSQSDWRPKPIPAAERYLNPYRDVAAYLGGPRSSSLDAFRIANIGLPAQFGPSAGMFQYYNVAAESNTFIPHDLVRELRTGALRATALPKYFQNQPDAFASAPWKRLSIRYYLFGPDVFAALPLSALAKRGLHVVPTASYWRVVEDDSAEPFVVGILSGGGHLPIDAAMTRDSFRLTVTPGTDTIRFAQNYDTWWHAYDDRGVDRSSLLRDDDGQLALSAQGLTGRRVLVTYADRAASIAIAVTIAVQLGLALAYLAMWFVAVRRRFVSRAAAG